MSNILIKLIDGTIRIQQIAESKVTAQWEKPIRELVFQKTEDTNLFVDKKDRYKIFLWKNINENILLVYSKGSQIRCYYTTEKGAYLRLLERENKILSASITEEKVTIQWFGTIKDKFPLTITNCRLNIDDRHFIEFQMPLHKKMLQEEDFLKKKYITLFEFETDKLITDNYDNPKTSFRLCIIMQVNGKDISFPLKMEQPDTDCPTTLIDSLYYKGYALKLRRSLTGSLTFIRRPMEPIERTWKFRILESQKISQFLYNRGLKYKENEKKKINLFYEKFAEKAEEGTYDVFLEALKSSTSKSYYIIDKKSEDYKKIRWRKHIVKKFSLKYYLLLYKASSYISTEAPIHVHIMQTQNNYFLKSIKKASFIFLQHGITYLKYHGTYSPFIAGKEGEPTYIAVGSEKEKKVVSEMLKLPMERILKTGLPIFSKISYIHLNQDSADIASIMLTWKPYEKSLGDFEESTYYRNVLRIWELLQKRLPKDNILIIAHPKMKEQLEKTALGQNIWKKPISHALATTKLLITDYSSSCYNTFYQGGGVVFFQEDLKLYEKVNGKLIPADNEYIGHRAFSIKELEQILETGISGGKIILSHFRTEEFEKNYQTINEFCDGQNIQRICEELKKLQII